MATDQIEETQETEPELEQDEAAEQVEDEVEPEETEVDEEPEPEAAKEETEPPWFRKRFDELTFAREQARREKEAAEQKAAELQKRLDEISQAPKDRPKLENFDSDEDYFDALADWKLDQREAKQRSEREKRQAEETAQSAESSYREQVMRVNKAGSSKYKDYEDVVFSLPGDVMNVEMAQALFETDAPEDIAYLLGKNPKEAARIAKLSPMKKAVELGRIESRLKTKKQTSSAPAPIKPLKSTTDSGFDPDELLKRDPGKWIQMRNEGKI